MTVVRRLAGYFRPYSGAILVSSLLLAASGALMSAVVAALKPLVNDVLVPAGGAGDTGAWEPLRLLLERLALPPLAAVPAAIVLIFFVRSLLLYFGQYLSTRTGAKVLRDLRADLFASIAAQSQTFFLSHPASAIASHVLNDVQRIQAAGTRLLADFVRIAAMVPFLLVVVFVHDWRMSLLAAVALPALGYPMVRLGRRLRRASTLSQQRMADVAGRVHESVRGIKIVQSFGREAYEADRFRGALDRMLAADLKAGRAAALSPAVLELVGAIAGALLFFAAGVSIARGLVDRGDFMVVLGGLGLLYVSLRRLNTLNVEFQQALAAAARVFDLLDREREIRDEPGAVEAEEIARGIEFHGVAFDYGGERVLDGVDLNIAKGEVVALVGPSGSGKTTLTQLVPRFFDPTEGQVLLDGADLRGLTLRSLRGQIGLVTQEAVLFDDSLERNIAYGDDLVDATRVREAARAAYADDFIRRLPRGYDTSPGEGGVRLSAGQRQRITIARALYRDPPILILDEATSALDAESEANVQRALQRLLRGRTCLIVAHRLSTIRRADRIVVLDGGRIVETGTHDELLAQGGTYARLHALQSADPHPTAERPGP